MTPFTTVMMMSEHNTLKAGLTAKGMTQAQLATHLGVSQTAVNLWANGVEKVPAARLADLKRLLDYVPAVGAGSDSWTLAQADLGAFLNQGPLGFLVLAGFPKDVVLPYPVPSDVNLWKIKTWAAHMGVTEGQLVAQVAGAPITVRQLELVAEQGIKFEALTELVGNPYGAETVAVWFADNAPFESFKALRNAAAVRMLEEKAAYDGLIAVRWEKNAFDMDQLWATAQELA